MIRCLLCCLLFLMLALAAGAATTVVVNGKTVAVPVIEQGGIAFVDIVTLMKLLGGQATFDPKTHKLVIASAGQPAPGPKPATGGVMLPGDNGDFGNVYNMGKLSPLYFSLKRAEYTVGRIIIGDTLYAPPADQKMLVLHFTVQNPQKSDLFTRYDSLRMTVVDAMNVNHEMVTAWGDEESKNSFALSLKPAQTVSLYAAFMVPAKGDVPKLIVQAEEGAPVLRYDLRGKVAALAAPFADPADAKGLTALETVPAQLGTAYPYCNYDITLEKVEYAAGPFGEIAAEEGQRFLVATILLKNQAPNNTFTRWDSLTPTLTTTDGEECHYREMLLATANRGYSQELAPGKEMRLRLLFDIAADAKAATLALKEGESRTYEYTLTK